MSKRTVKKSGFIYIWYDKKHKRYYVGSHWGAEDDGYVCSSTWMRNAYKMRPNDFRRRILKRVYTSKLDLHAEEHRYLQMMKPEELKGIRYYNISNSVKNLWHKYPEQVKTIGQKITLANTGKKMSSYWSDPIGRGQKISAAKKGVKCSDEHRAAMSASRKGRVMTPEQKAKIAEGLKRAYAEGKRKSK